MLWVLCRFVNRYWHIALASLASQGHPHVCLWPGALPCPRQNESRHFAMGSHQIESWKERTGLTNMAQQASSAQSLPYVLFLRVNRELRWSTGFQKRLLNSQNMFPMGIYLTNNTNKHELEGSQTSKRYRSLLVYLKVNCTPGTPAGPPLWKLRQEDHFKRPGVMVWFSSRIHVQHVWSPRFQTT